MGSEKSDVLAFRTWKSFVDNEEKGLVPVWAKAMVQLALAQHMESPKADQIPAPEFDDAVQVFNDAASKKLLPPWWPEKFERVVVKIRVTPAGETSDSASPPPIDPNTTTLGSTTFANVIVSQLERFGDEFSGEVDVKILRATDKSVLGGMRLSEVFVGVKQPKKKRGGSSDGDRSELTDFLLERDKETRADMQRMFAHSSQVIASSAALVNATRGVNTAPPWMQDGEGSPLWMALINGAMQIGGSLLAGKSPKDQIRQMMTEPVNHPMLPGGQEQRPGQGNGGAKMLPDYGGSGPNYGNDQFLEDGQYDGFHVMDDDMLDDGFDDDYGYGPDDDSEEDWDEEEEEEEEEQPRKRRGSTSTKSNPLIGRSAEEVERMMEEWLPSQDKGKLQQVGARLASKILR